MKITHVLVQNIFIVSMPACDKCLYTYYRQWDFFKKNGAGTSSTEVLKCHLQISSHLASNSGYYKFRKAQGCMETPLNFRKKQSWNRQCCFPLCFLSVSFLCCEITLAYSYPLENETVFYHKDWLLSHSPQRQCLLRENLWESLDFDLCVDWQG